MKLLGEADNYLSTIKDSLWIKLCVTVVVAVLAFYTLGFLLKTVLYIAVGLGCLYVLYKLWGDSPALRDMIDRVRDRD